MSVEGNSYPCEQRTDYIFRTDWRAVVLLNTSAFRTYSGLYHFNLLNAFQGRLWFTRLNVFLCGASGRFGVFLFIFSSLPDGNAGNRKAGAQQTGEKYQELTGESQYAAGVYVIVRPNQLVSDGCFVIPAVNMIHRQLF